MRTQIADLISKLRDDQKFKSNVDGIIYDYSFYTDLEKLAKKSREEHLKKALAAGGNKPLVDGIVADGNRLAIELVIGVMSRFDKELFISKILTAFPEIPSFRLRELATEAVVRDGERKVFKVVNKNESF